MKFGAMYWLLAIPILSLGLLGLWTWAGHRARRTLETAWNTPLLARLTSSVNPLRRQLKRAGVLFGLVFLAVALARPQWGQNEIELERTGVDLMIALDVSRSMLASDAGGTNRLNAATAALQRLMGKLGGDRVGLVIFAGEAFVAAPLTRDHTAVDRALTSAGPWSVSRQGSNLGEAIKKAAESFERAAQGPRALLVVSDGEQLQGEAVQASQAASREGIRVNTAGVGSGLGARVPFYASDPTRIVRNAAGREVVSRRDEQRLQSIATSGGGRYVRIEGPHSTTLIDWFREASANLPRSTEKRTVNEPKEQFQWMLAAAFVFLGAEWILGERRKRIPESGGVK